MAATSFLKLKTKPLLSPNPKRIVDRRFTSRIKFRASSCKFASLKVENVMRPTSNSKLEAPQFMRCPSSKALDKGMVMETIVKALKIPSIVMVLTLLMFGSRRQSAAWASGPLSRYNGRYKNKYFDNYDFAVDECTKRKLRSGEIEEGLSETDIRILKRIVIGLFVVFSVFFFASDCKEIRNVKASWKDLKRGFMVTNKKSKGPTSEVDDLRKQNHELAIKFENAIQKLEAISNKLENVLAEANSKDSSSSRTTVPRQPEASSTSRMTKLDNESN